ncbi:hypothetical protein INT43_007398 [Umbelopsis isabellina]|uniref:RING-type E3 ubiquitin transferase n=1 Tax=Mortierella isabellina TaxID=91625 RepID=A0A8H7UJW5_MORIS|nr:hypothetical protein INT43_007398 [Umbelopsis isabellina]
MAPGPTCTICNDQFVEEFEEQAEAPSFYDEQDSAWEDVLERNRDSNDPISETLQSMLQSWTTPNVNVTVQTSPRTTDTSRPAEHTTTDDSSRTEYSNSNFGEDSDTDSENGTTNNTRQGQDTVRIMQLMNIIQQILSRADGGTNDPLDIQVLAGNPDDYVFTQNGLDDVITQLLEQATNRNAPPPATEDVIAKLKSRTTTSQDVDENQDCSVCKEDFGVAEQVLILPCQHFFHQDCIKQWLQVNGTCPICRHSLVGSSGEEMDVQRTDEHVSQPPQEVEEESNTDDEEFSNNQSTRHAGRVDGHWTSLIPGIFRWTSSSSPYPRPSTTSRDSASRQEQDDNMDALD